jgi:hypothetical protein
VIFAFWSQPTGVVALVIALVLLAQAALGGGPSLARAADH